MSTSAPLDRNDPTMLAWNAFRETEEYANAARWAISPQDTAGSLWCAFAAGFAALRAALAEEKRAHEESSVCIQIVRERVEGILANWMRPPGGQQAGVPDKSINPDTCRAILRALSSEQGSYTWEEFQRISAERDSEQRWAKEYHDKWQAAERRAEEAERERDEEQAKRLESQVQAMTLLAERDALASRLAEERRYLREAFSAGAAWWEEHSTGGTMWQSDRHLVDDEAERRYVNGEWVTGPLVNRLEACLLATEKKLAEAVGVLRRATDLLSSVKHHLRSDDPARAAVESFLASLAPETKGGKV